jgi:CheY-like chemotaxis protein
MSILIVEDNVISARMLEGILKHNGMETITAKNGVLALQVLQERQGEVQVILLDLMMPEMDGFQFMKEHNDHPQWKSIPVIVMTALADTETVRRVVGMGCKHYVVKPVREDMLLPKLREYLPHVVSAEDHLLRNRFHVMQDMGLDDSGYDELFAAFRDQTRQILQSLGQEGAAFPKAALGSFADDAMSLCGEAVSKRLHMLAETSAANDASNYLQHLMHELDTAFERRARIKARLSGQE